MKKIFGVLLFLASISQANAGFLGNTLDADYLFPDIGTVFSTMSDQVVGAGVEWNIFNVSVDADDSSITLSKSSSQVFSSGAFNGWSFTDLNGTIDDIIAVTVDSSTNLSGFDASRVTFTDDSIFLNFAGLATSEQFFSAKVNVEFASTAVPEPSIVFLFGLGLLGLAFSRRKVGS